MDEVEIDLCGGGGVEFSGARSVVADGEIGASLRRHHSKKRKV